MSVPKSGQFAQEIPCPGHKSGCNPLSTPALRSAPAAGGTWNLFVAGQGGALHFHHPLWASTSCCCPCPVSPPLPGLRGGPARIGQFGGFPNLPPKSEKKTWRKIFPEMELKNPFLLKKRNWKWLYLRTKREWAGGCLLGVYGYDCPTAPMRERKPGNGFPRGPV